MERAGLSQTHALSHQGTDLSQFILIRVGGLEFGREQIQLIGEMAGDGLLLRELVLEMAGQGGGGVGGGVGVAAGVAAAEKAAADLAEISRGRRAEGNGGAFPVGLGEVVFTGADAVQKLNAIHGA